MNEIEKAIQVLASFHTDEDDDIREAVEITVPILEEKLKGRWIPVSEILPECNKPVLLFLRCGSGKEIQVVGYLFYTEEEYFKTCNNEYSTYDGEDLPNFLVKAYVKAWMPLPEPYKEE